MSEQEKKNVIIQRAEEIATLSKGMAGVAAIAGVTYTGLSTWAATITAKQAMFAAVAALSSVLALQVSNYNTMAKMRRQMGDGGKEHKEITERRINLLEAQLRLQRLADEVVWNHVEVASYRTDGTGHCIAVNDAFCELFGLTREQMLDYGWSAAIPDTADRARIISTWQESLETRIPYLETYKVRNAKTGQEYYVQTSARSSYNPLTGALDGSVGVAKRFEPDAHRRAEDRV